MLDVHPAPHAAHTWKDFLIHIATIVLGLLIAIGLEQIVERVHHLHQRDSREAALHEESLKNRRVLEYDLISLQDTRRTIRRNMDALDRLRLSHEPQQAFTPVLPTHDTFMVPLTTAWFALRDTASLELVSDDVAENYWKVDYLSQAIAASIDNLAVARKRVNALLYLHSSPSMLTPEERNDLLHAYSAEDQELGNLHFILIAYNAMNEAALAGKVLTIDDLTAISAQAQKVEGPPPAP